jgi:hypothetical protein
MNATPVTTQTEPNFATLYLLSLAGPDQGADDRL